MFGNWIREEGSNRKRSRATGKLVKEIGIVEWNCPKSIYATVKTLWWCQPHGKKIMYKGRLTKSSDKFQINLSPVKSYGINLSGTNQKVDLPALGDLLISANYFNTKNRACLIFPIPRATFKNLLSKYQWGK